MVTTLYLIRHGETEGADKMRYKGTLDVPLSEEGVRQIEKVSRSIPVSVGLRAVYCSDLSRAMKSAGIIASPHGLKPLVVPGLRERNFGIWEGMSFDEIREKYPREFSLWMESPVEFGPLEGESTLEVKERVIKALNGIISGHNDEHIVIAAHGGPNRIILCHLLGMPLENIFRIEQDYAAINIIEFRDGYPVVKLINGGPIG